jgi:predicted CxxxxCH...CXXCH cytochrome family protein
LGGIGGAGGIEGAGGIGGMAGIGGAGGVGGTTRVHAVDYVVPDVHGSDLRLGVLDCRACHGSDLNGNPPALSCDACHTPAEPTAWRTDCIFCHGGVDDLTGAPPKNLDGTLTSAEGAFPPHHVHVESQLSDPLDCVQCHVKAVDVLSVGHVFDATPGVAEVDLAAGLSPQGTYSPGEGCQNLYCHGDGQGDNGAVNVSAPPMTCNSCHAGLSSGSAGWDQMGGLHSFHLSSGASCEDCHQATTANGTSIADPSRHVNAIRDVQLSAGGLAWNESERTCTGSCHGHAHAASSWIGGAQRFHPLGYAQHEQHSPDMELQRMDCRTCHGADLMGGLGPSCDTCHSDGWRSDCLFCHGGDDNFTGAPPRDLGALPMSGSQAFLGHTAHVSERISAAYDCLQCHSKPSDVLTVGHAFDDTPGRAEVSFVMGLSAAGDYDGAGTCTSVYCHGNGQADTGLAVDGTGPMDCDSCHAGMASSESAWGSMSGDHRKHLREGFDCGDCHLDVTSDGQSILDASLHVDRNVQLHFSDALLIYNSGTGRCSGTCHGETHNNHPW